MMPRNCMRWSSRSISKRQSLPTVASCWRLRRIDQVGERGFVVEGLELAVEVRDGVVPGRYARGFFLVGVPGGDT